MNEPRVLIIGGGIAGLSAAWRLLHPRTGAFDRAVRPEITLIEADTRLGGKIRTEQCDGFVIDSGPDSFLTTRPWALELVNELGLSDQLIGTMPDARRAFILRGDRLHALPAGLSGLVPSRASAWMAADVLSLAGRVRAMLDLIIPAAQNPADESIAAFAQRRFGREASDWLLEPLLAGIHGGPGDLLSLRATFPALADAERRTGSVMRGLRAANTAAHPHPLGVFVSLRDGLQQLTDKLHENIPECEILTDTRVALIEHRGDGWLLRTDRGESFSADAVVVATPANAASPLFRSVHPRLAGLLGSIPFASSTVVHLTFDASALHVPLQGSGYLNPRRGGRTVAACTWSSAKFANRAPAGRVLLRAFLKGNAAEFAIDDAVRVTCEELASVAGITSLPLTQHVFRYAQAMPQYTLGHLERVSNIERELLASPGLFLAGHSYRGIGIPDAIHSGEVAADSALRHVNTSRINAL